MYKKLYELNLTLVYLYFHAKDSVIKEAVGEAMNLNKELIDAIIDREILIFPKDAVTYKDYLIQNKDMDNVHSIGIQVIAKANSEALIDDRDYQLMSSNEELNTSYKEYLKEKFIHMSDKIFEKGEKNGK